MGCVLKIGFVGRSRLGACAMCGFVFPLMPVNVGCSHSRRGERWRAVGAGVIRVAMGVGGLVGGLYVDPLVYEAVGGG